MHTKKKTPAESVPPPKNPLMRKLRERKIFETVAAFVGVGWLILEFVHWILVDHYKWPERLIDLTFITLLGALLISLTWRWFRSPAAKQRKVKIEYLLIPLFLIITLILDIQVLIHLNEGHGSQHGQSDYEKKTASHLDDLAAPVNSIAVLPFRSLGPASEKDLLHEGMTDALIGKLSSLQDLRVISRTSVLKYRDSEADIQAIGAELNVASVLEGSVQQEQETLRIGVRLYSAIDGYQIWSQTYDRQLNNIFAIQDEIAQSVTEALKITLAPEKAAVLSKHGTDNLKAYNLYLQGRRLWDKRTRASLEQAIDFFKQAVQTDPDFAPAYSGIADSLIAMANTSALSPGDAYPEARDWARRALLKDNTLAEAHASIAVTKLFYEWDWEGTEIKFRKAMEVNNSYAFAHQTYALFLSAMGRHKEARKAMNRALELDPASDIIAAASGVIAYMAGDSEKASAQLEALIEKSPNFPLGFFYLGWLNVQQGNLEEAALHLRQALSLAGGDPRIRAWLGFVLWKSGDKEGGRAVHRELEAQANSRYVDPSFIALLHLGMGQTTEALSWLEKGFEEHSFWMIWLNVDPVFDPLRTEPRFQALLARLNFPDRP